MEINKKVKKIIKNLPEKDKIKITKIKKNKIIIKYAGFTDYIEFYNFIGKYKVKLKIPKQILIKNYNEKGYQKITSIYLKHLNNYSFNYKKYKKLLKNYFSIIVKIFLQENSTLKQLKNKKIKKKISEILYNKIKNRKNRKKKVICEDFAKILIKHFEKQNIISFRTNNSFTLEYQFKKDNKKIIIAIPHEILLVIYKEKFTFYNTIDIGKFPKILKKTNLKIIDKIIFVNY